VSFRRPGVETDDTLAQHDAGGSSDVEDHALPVSKLDVAEAEAAYAGIPH